MTKEIEDRWAALTAQFTRSVLDPAETIEDAVLPGQLREAVWGDSEATVLVVAVDDANAKVVVNPVSLEPGVADADSVVLGADATPLRGGLSVWPSIEATLSFVVLDGVVAQLPVDIMGRIRNSGSARVPASPGNDGQSSRFAGVPLPGSGAALAIDELFDTVDELVAVHPPQSQQAPKGPPAEFPLGLSALMTALEITQSEAMAVIRGKRTLNPDQAETVADVANVPIAQVTAAQRPLPADLLRELMEPRWRSVIRQRSGPGGEIAAREELGRSAFALAARAKGTGRDVWRQRIQAVLAAESI
jgi:hypothetical protein